MEWVLPLLGGLGLGSALKSTIDHIVARRSLTKDRLYGEKREAYIGLLGAYTKQPSNILRPTRKTTHFGRHAVSYLDQRKFPDLRRPLLTQTMALDLLDMQPLKA